MDQNGLVAHRVRVYARVRPIAAGIAFEGDQDPRNIRFQENTVLVSKKLNTNQAQAQADEPALDSFLRLDTDRLFSGDAANQDLIVPLLATELVETIAQGCNASVVGYGGTATGKTFSVLGNAQNPGMLFATAETILTKIQAREAGFVGSTLNFAAQIIYKGEIKNLLEEQPSKVTNPEDPLPFSVIVPNLEIFNSVVSKAVKSSRLSASTHMASLARGHVLFSLLLSHPTTFEEKPIRVVRFFDLNGPEKLLPSTAKNESTLESIAINEQLSSLRLIIDNLSAALQKKGLDTKAQDLSHIFSGSKLGKLISSSLNPASNCRCMFLMTLSPSSRFHSDSKDTVLFGQSLRKLQQNYHA